MKKAHIAVLALLFAAAALGVVAWSRSESPTAAPDAPRTGTLAAPTAARAVPTVSNRRFQTATRSTYALETSQTISFGASAASTTIALEGKWLQTVMGTDGDRVQLQIQLESPTLTMLSGDTPQRSAEADAWQDELARPFYLTLHRNGLIDSAFMPPETSQFAEAMLLSVAATAQLVVPPEHGGTWTIDERDPTGEYKARYERRGAEDIVKHKTLYTKLASGQGYTAPPSDDAVNVSGTTVFSRSGTAVSLVDHQETLDIKLSQQSAPVRSNRTLTLSLRSSGPVNIEQTFAARIAGLERVSFDGVVEAGDSQTREDVRLVDGASLSELLAALQAASDNAARSRLLVRLGAYFRQNPGAVEAAVNDIVDGLPGEAESTLIGALGDAGNEAAQAGLAELAQNGELEVSPRLQSIAALGLVPEPNPTNVAALEKLADSDDPEIRNSALLAVGAAAGRTSQGARLIDDLLARWDRARSSAERILILEALGNTSSVRALPAIKEGMSSTVAAVRGAAYAALRFIPDATVDEWLQAGMFDDPSPGVRQEIVFAIGFRAVLPFMPALETLLLNEEHPAVRLEAVAIIGARATELDGALSLLATVADRDSDEKVRDAAQRYISDAASSESL